MLYWLYVCTLSQGGDTKTWGGAVTPSADSGNTDWILSAPRKSPDLSVKETKQRKADSNTRVDNNFIWAVL